jgi:Ran GTPase-activating protein (RanGAP) involved in mRNA processing and transport
MSIIIKSNIKVEKLLLDGNWIEAEGAKYISRMIRQNDFITELSLVDNRVGETLEGTTEICRMISENCVLKKLNLSCNNFSDKNVQDLVEAFEVIVY